MCPFSLHSSTPVNFPTTSKFPASISFGIGLAKDENDTTLLL